MARLISTSWLMPRARRDLRNAPTRAADKIGASRLGWAAEIGTLMATAFEPRQSDRWGLTSHPRGPRLGAAALVEMF